MIKLKLKEGMYIRYLGNIDKILVVIIDENNPNLNKVYAENETVFFSDIEKASFNLIELIEYMDLLEIENPVKLYGEDRKISLFNPVRCDGFTEFEDGTHCIILNLDYLVDVKDLKIKSVLTKEQFETMKSVVERDK